MFGILDVLLKNSQIYACKHKQEKWLAKNAIAVIINFCLNILIDIYWFNK